MKHPKRLWIVLAVLIIAARGIGWQMMRPKTGATAPQTAIVTRGDVAEVVLATGAIEAKQLVSVGARVSGQVEKIDVSLGQVVQAGDVIAQIDRQDQENDLLRAEAALAGIDAQIAAKTAALRRAQLVLERQTKLGAQDLVSKDAIESGAADVDVLRADLTALAAQKSSADVTVASAKIGLERTTIVAPIAGTVVAIVVEEGQTVNAANNAPTIVKLANLDQMVVKAEVSEADVVHVKAGQKASFTILGAPEDQFDAVVSALEPAPSQIKSSDTIDTEKAVYYIALLEVDNPAGKLRIGMTAQVSIILAEVKNVLTIPAAALTGSKVQTYSTLTGPTDVQVDVGLNNKVTAEIRSGLSEGDVVVTGAADAPNLGSGGGGRRGGPPGFGG
jgi:macrolide-specific efflux system membrane fusion protein